MVYPFKVNGVEVEMTQEKVICHDILELAEKRGALPGKVEDYVLQGEIGTRYERQDWIDLSTDKSFIALLNQPTPVA